MPEKRGFLILSSQNASTEKGRKSLSPALLNRAHFIYMDTFSEAEVQAIAKNRNILYPDVFTEHYFKMKQAYPAVINTRALHQVLDELTQSTIPSSTPRVTFFAAPSTLKNAPSPKNGEEKEPKPGL